MRHDLRTLDDAGSVARIGAALIADAAALAVEARGGCTIALSGGTTPWAMLAELAEQPLDWSRVAIYQVDERLAPDGDADRNSTHLAAGLAGLPVRFEAMPVTAADPDAGAATYAATLPARFDVVHLGLGADGHTASLVPGDAVLSVTDRLVAVTAPYAGHRRMTLTYPALSRAALLVWLVTGADKAAALGRLLDGDAGIPASGVEASASVVLADTAAAGSRGVAAGAP